MDIVITIPKSIKWEDYQKELKVVESGEQTMFFKVPTLPKKANVGDRCYLCHNGRVVGYMNITWMGTMDGFTCTTTDIPWPKGNYIGRSGKFTYIKSMLILYKGFQGYRYAPQEWRQLN